MWLLGARLRFSTSGRLPSTRAILARGSRGDALGVAQDEVEVAGVDEEARALTQDEDGIAAPEGVEEQGQAAADREIPEGAGHDALAQTLRGDPLDEEARGEKGLAEKANAEPDLVRGHITPSSWRSIVERARRRVSVRGERRGLGGAAEHRAQDVIGLADVLWTPPSRDEREDLLGLLGRHGAVLVADVGEIAQRHLERDRHAVETVDGDGLLAALDLADEFPAESGSFAESFLAERALFAEGAKTLTEEFSDVFDGALCHGTVILLVVATLTTFPWFRNRSHSPGGRSHTMSACRSA